MAKSFYVALFSRYKHLLFFNLCKKFKNSKWPPFLAGQNFLKLCQLLSRRTLRDKNFVKITLSSTIFEIQAFLCFTFFEKKNRKFKMDAILVSEILVETWKG